MSNVDLNNMANKTPTYELKILTGSFIHLILERRSWKHCSNPPATPMTWILDISDPEGKKF